MTHKASLEWWYFIKIISMFSLLFFKASSSFIVLVRIHNYVTRWAWWKGRPAVDHEKGCGRRRPLENRSFNHFNPIFSFFNLIKKMVDVLVDVDHPALFYLVDGRHPLTPVDMSTSVDVHFTALFITPHQIQLWNYPLKGFSRYTRIMVRSQNWRAVPFWYST